LDAAAKLRPTKAGQNDWKYGKPNYEPRQTWPHTNLPHRGRQTSTAALNCELAFSLAVAQIGTAPSD
ncbi:MAG: hypothetical protein LAQ69_51635, partial [Acidobacteriia bacterium]|nr:hypothetical protein [Terriglobia bacterium]